MVSMFSPLLQRSSVNWPGGQGILIHRQGVKPGRREDAELHGVSQGSGFSTHQLCVLREVAHHL